MAKVQQCGRIKMLTKSNYLLGLQCPKLLWVTKNNKERLPELSEVAKAKFKDGELIGNLAKKLFPEGKDLSKLDFKGQLDKTKELLEKRVPLFEAAFLIDDLYSRSDILVPTGKNHWDIIEVKSATKIKEVNIDDVSFQKYVYKKSGLKIRNCFIMYVNNEYVKEGEMNPEAFFSKEDINDRVEEKSLDIEKRIENMLRIINSKKEPKCSIGVHCSNPYDCSITGECWESVPDESVFEFYRLRKSSCFGLYDMNIKKMKDVSDGVKLNEKQQIQRRLACDGGEHVNKKELTNFLKELQYPIYYLDFETINPALPKFDGMKAYQRIPFQFSLHIQEKPDGELNHISFLAEGTSDPRKNFLQSLKDNLGEKGTILVYYQSFEKGVLREGVEAYQEFNDWLSENIMPRIKDLWDVFGQFLYYNPKQKGRSSIKYVLPVLSDLKYDELDIKKGDVASFEYNRVTYGSVDEKERQRVRDALEKYCELDTLAEVKIVDALWELVK